MFQPQRTLTEPGTADGFRVAGKSVGPVLAVGTGRPRARAGRRPADPRQQRGSAAGWRCSRAARRCRARGSSAAAPPSAVPPSCSCPTSRTSRRSCDVVLYGAGGPIDAPGARGVVVATAVPGRVVGGQARARADRRGDARPRPRGPRVAGRARQPRSPAATPGGWSTCRSPTRGDGSCCRRCSAARGPGSWCCSPLPTTRRSRCRCSPPTAHRARRPRRAHGAAGQGDRRPHRQGHRAAGRRPRADQQHPARRGRAHGVRGDVRRHLRHRRHAAPRRTRSRHRAVRGPVQRAGARGSRCRRAAADDDVRRGAVPRPAARR